MKTDAQYNDKQFVTESASQVSFSFSSLGLKVAALLPTRPNREQKIKVVCARIGDIHLLTFFITDFNTNQMFLFLFSCFTIASRNE